MGFPSSNSAPSCNPPSLFCVISWVLFSFSYLSWISMLLLGFKHVSSIFRKHCLCSNSYPLLCKFGLLSCSAHVGAELQPHQDLSLAGAGGLHLESPCPLFSPQCKTSAKWNKMLWVDDHQDGRGDGVQDKKDWETGFVHPGKKRRQRGILLPLFTWLEKDIGKMEWGLSQKCTIFEQDKKDTSDIKKNSTLERKTNSLGRWCSTKTGPRASVRVHHWRH